MPNLILRHLQTTAKALPFLQKKIQFQILKALIIQHIGIFPINY